MIKATAPEWAPASFEWAEEIADEVVDRFTLSHPEVVMRYYAWSDLKEIISRTIRGLDWDVPK
jgi:hypothetical protein